MKLWFLFFSCALGDVTFKVSDVVRESTQLPRRAEGPLGLVSSRLIASSSVPFPRVASLSSEMLDTCGMGDLNGVFGFVQAAALGFAYHLPLSLKADHFWQLILQGIALHVSKDPNGLKHVFASKHFLETGQKLPITVGVSRFSESVFSLLSERVLQSLADTEVRHLFLANFSTTTELDRIVQHVTLLDTTKSFFDFEIITMCGIPQITLQGLVDDWQKLQQQAKALLEKVGMKWWYEGMSPYLQLMVDSFDESSNKTLWESFFKYRSQSGGDRVDGFLMAFHPYVGEKLEVNPWFGQTNLDDEYDRGVDSKRIPLPQGKVPITLDFKATHVYAGFTAPGQMEDGTITPMVAWALVEDVKLQE